jgi:hypothetical protein
VPDARPVAAPRFAFGKKSLQATHQWEGVVEEIGASGFRARLLPLVGGKPDPRRIEFTTFAFDDLANDDDRDLVSEGAIFYWTVGKGRNAAGTVSNVSLVRFRRVPPPGAFQERVAKAEAAELLQELGGNPSS